MSEGVRPVFPGSGGQNRKTAPPLASGHLNERSAPGVQEVRVVSLEGVAGIQKTGWEDRTEENTDKTQKEEKRLVKEVETGTGEYL